MFDAEDEPDSATNNKILRFKSFVDNVLQVDLQKYYESSMSKEADINEWRQLKDMIALLKKENMSSFRGKMNLGANVSVEVDVPDTGTIIMSLGCGVFVSMSLDNASTHVNYKIQVLEAELVHMKDTMANLKAQIQVVLQGINELEAIQ